MLVVGAVLLALRCRAVRMGGDCRVFGGPQGEFGEGMGRFGGHQRARDGR